MSISLIWNGTVHENQDWWIFVIKLKIHELFTNCHKSCMNMKQHMLYFISLINTYLNILLLRLKLPYVIKNAAMHKNNIKICFKIILRNNSKNLYRISISWTLQLFHGSTTETLYKLIKTFLIHSSLDHQIHGLYSSDYTKLKHSRSTLVE